MYKNNLTIKILSIILLFIALMGLTMVNSNPLFNQTATVSLNSSSGKFYQTDDYNFSDYIRGDGVSVVYEKNFNYISNIIKPTDATLIKTEKVNGITSYYYYSKNLARRVKVDNKLINLHVAVSTTAVTVGYPLIYYAY